MARATEAGFTLTEMMVVVVIVGVLSAVAVPSLRREKTVRAGRDYGYLLGRELQRARIQAVADRLPVRVYFFGDRTEFRSYVPSAALADAPAPPADTDPTSRVVFAPDNVRIFNVGTLPTPPTGPALTGTAFRMVDLTVLGQAQFVGAPMLTGAFVFVRNIDLNGVLHPDRDTRIELTPLSGSAVVRDSW
jgi:prepilin-type N-terminal cleavage/methylation domain-containing protein